MRERKWKEREKFNFSSKCSKDGYNKEEKIAVRRRIRPFHLHTLPIGMQRKEGFLIKETVFDHTLSS